MIIIIIGLIILVAAVVVGVAGVLSDTDTDTGSRHGLTDGFEVFGYHVTGSSGTLFLDGIIVGAVALFGLSLLLTGARRTSRRGHAARHGLKQSRRETAAAGKDRDGLIDQRDTARAETASTRGNDSSSHDDLIPAMSIAKKIAHKAEAVKGGVKKAVGRITGSRRLRAEGRDDQVKGNTKQAGAEIKEALRH